MNLLQNILNKANTFWQNFSLQWVAKLAQKAEDKYKIWDRAYEAVNASQDPIQRFLDDSTIDSTKKQALLNDLQTNRVPLDAVKSYISDKYYGNTFGNRVITWLGNRFKTAEESLNTNKSTIEKWASLLKDVIATPFDIVWAGIQPVVEPVLKPIMETAPVQYGMEKYGQFREANPRLAQNIEAWVWIWTAFLPATKWGQAVIKAPGKAVVNTAWKIAPTMKSIPKAIKKAPWVIDDAIESWVEKLATKALGSSDGTAELFKATSPSYNVLAKSKDISKIKQKAVLADKAVIDAGFVPKTTTERVSAYSNAMKKYWKEVEDARGASKVEFDAGEISKVIDDEIERLSVKWVVNPAIQWDINALLKQAEYFRWLGKIDMPTLGNQRTLINTITDWGAKTEYWDTFSAVMKKAAAKIRDAEDTVLWSVWNGKASDALWKYGALRSMYDDIVKQDIKALRAKWLPIEESFGRIAGTAELLWWIWQLVMNPKQAIPSILSGGSKVLLGKVAWKMKDSDYLIRTGYEKLLKSKNTTNGISKWTTPVVRTNSTSTASKQKIVKPSPQVKPVDRQAIKSEFLSTSEAKLSDTELKNLAKSSLQKSKSPTWNGRVNSDNIADYKTYARIRDYFNEIWDNSVAKMESVVKPVEKTVKPKK